MKRESAFTTDRGNLNNDIPERRSPVRGQAQDGEKGLNIF